MRIKDATNILDKPAFASDTELFTQQETFSFFTMADLGVRKMHYFR